MAKENKTGFSLIELLVVIAIIGALAAVATLSLGAVRQKTRDTKRKADLSQIGRFFSLSCFMPAAGAGEYDLADLIAELKTQYPQYANFISKTPADPRRGTDSQSYYKYIVAANGKKCTLYANLENENEPITLPALTAPAAGGGTGTLKATANGWNDSDKYFQVSN